MTLKNPKNSNIDVTDNFYFCKFHWFILVSEIFLTGRFAAETVLSILSVLFNILAFCAVQLVHGHRTVYHLLFTNLSIANILCSILSWLCNNALFLFEQHIAILIITRKFSYVWLQIANKGILALSLLWSPYFNSLSYSYYCTLHQKKPQSKSKCGHYS